MGILDIASSSEHIDGWLGTNWIDVGASSVEPDGMLEHHIPTQMLAFQCKNIVDYAAIETLVTVPQIDGFGASGQFFSALDNARLQLIHAQNEAEEQFRLFVARLQAAPDPQIEQLPSTLTFEKLLEFFDQQPRFSYTPPLGMLRFLLDARLVRNLLRRVYGRMAKIPKIRRMSRPRFCGLSWSRRLWFLLHGSHPPKSECCPAFGCA
jgi:hypothetical protein